MAIEPQQLQQIFSQLQQMGLPNGTIQGILSDVQRDGLQGLEASLRANQVPLSQAQGLLSIARPPEQFAQIPEQSISTPAQAFPAPPLEAQAPPTGFESLRGAIPGSRFPTLPFDQELGRFEAVSAAEQSDLEKARARQFQESMADDDLYRQAGAAESGDIERAIARLRGERAGEAGAFEGLASRNQAELEAARQRQLGEAGTAFQSTLGQARTAFGTGFEERLRQARQALGARGLGSSGFDGSGALQDLGAREAANVEAQSIQAALPAYIQAQQQFQNTGLEAARLPFGLREDALGRQLSNADIYGELGTAAETAQSPFRRAQLERRMGARDVFADQGYEAALTPATYRRSAFQRALDENARLAGAGMDFEIADMARGAQESAARQQSKGLKQSALIGAAGSLIGAGLGAFGGGRTPQAPATLGFDTNMGTGQLRLSPYSRSGLAPFSRTSSISGSLYR